MMSLFTYNSSLLLSALMTHASVPPDQRKILGIGDNFVRLSVGIEDVDDLINDLDHALKAAVSSGWGIKCLKQNMLVNMLNTLFQVV